jgi:hypothetical protein
MFLEVGAVGNYINRDRANYHLKSDKLSKRFNMKEIYTEIEIQASSERVWQVLTDLEHFSQWNPFIRSAKGELKVGSQIEILIQPPDASAMKFRPHVLKVEPNREFRWLGNLLIPGLFDGEHIFIIDSLSENKVIFRHFEQFRGILIPLLWKSLDTNARQGFNEMNTALKKLVESTNN